MPRITFIRHGKPEAHIQYPLSKLLKGQEIENFVKAWDNCELSISNKIPVHLWDSIKDANLFISSDLKRAKDSFQMMGVKDFKTTCLLNEATLPCGIWKRIILPLFIWLLFLRILWIGGFKGKGESYKDFKIRMYRATDYIENLMVGSHHLVVMTHGFVMRSISKILITNKWRRVSKEKKYSYWSFITFEKS
ncbi:MAG: phosphoglycerate mutase family protein [Chitinivibrionales bacterium]